MNNEAVSAVQHEDVFGVHGDQQEDGQCTLYAIYCRTASAWT